ncbi:MAG: DUF934 domain-containing protein [Myxococcales bacterium]|nr:DUF934 domain-containing protein [Myxococcales bacterium]
MESREIVLDGAVVADPWVFVADDEPIPSQSGRADAPTSVAPPRVFVTLGRWRADRAALAARGRVGVVVPSDLDIRTLADDLPLLAAVALEFPRFADGRAYTQARILREQLGFLGSVRARGEVLRDQAFYMVRCGFDVLEPAPGRAAADLLPGLSDFSVTYQGAADTALPRYRRPTPDTQRAVA